MGGKIERIGREQSKGTMTTWSLTKVPDVKRRRLPFCSGCMLRRVIAQNAVTVPGNARYTDRKAAKFVSRYEDLLTADKIRK